MPVHVLSMLVLGKKSLVFFVSMLFNHKTKQEYTNPGKKIKSKPISMRMLYKSKIAILYSMFPYHSRSIA